MYKNITTLAQHEVIKKDLRDKYFEAKAQEMIAK